MKINMLENAKGCDDGIHSKEYEAGQSYDVSESLANNFVEMKVAEIVGEKSKAAHENKALDEGDYQNKSDKRK